ncbi:hypothetical protein CYMTET_32088 [Cymbomonas tetramitiformis]|uniref:Uncharacterized protein n=1 Tax=Cymbomonas tetramitiformis TaxID=36881 RepID=A0AAE0KSA4_9CHLO|nr:hypothetical protein CYMTET_32088 [Cymbomonas tetramitiformis]
MVANLTTEIKCKFTRRFLGSCGQKTEEQISPETGFEELRKFVCEQFDIDEEDEREIEETADAFIYEKPVMQLWKVPVYYDSRVPSYSTICTLLDEVSWEDLVTSLRLDTEAWVFHTGNFLHAKLEQNDHTLTLEGVEGLWELVFSHSRSHYDQLSRELLRKLVELVDVPLEAHEMAARKGVENTHARVSIGAMTCLWTLSASKVARHQLVDLGAIEAVLDLLRTAQNDGVNQRWIPRPPSTTTPARPKSKLLKGRVPGGSPRKSKSVAIADGSSPTKSMDTSVALLEPDTFEEPRLLSPQDCQLVMETAIGAFTTLACDAYGRRRLYRPVYDVTTRITPQTVWDSLQTCCTKLSRDGMLGSVSHVAARFLSGALCIDNRVAASFTECGGSSMLGEMMSIPDTALEDRGTRLLNPVTKAAVVVVIQLGKMPAGRVALVQHPAVAARILRADKDGGGSQCEARLAAPKSAGASCPPPAALCMASGRSIRTKGPHLFSAAFRTSTVMHPLVVMFRMAR